MCKTRKTLSGLPQLLVTRPRYSLTYWTIRFTFSQGTLAQSQNFHRSIKKIDVVNTTILYFLRHGHYNIMWVMSLAETTILNHRPNCFQLYARIATVIVTQIVQKQQFWEIHDNIIMASVGGWILILSSSNTYMRKVCQNSGTYLVGKL